MHAFSIKAVVVPVLAAWSASAAFCAAAATDTRTSRSADPAPSASGSGRGASVAGTTTVYRSTMPDGRVVLGDRPEPAARAVDVIASVAVDDRSSASRAQQERDYWRQRSEAFAQRHLMRQRDEERERMALAAERRRDPRHAPYVASVYGAPALYRPRALLNYTGHDVLPQYGTTPGAAGRNLAIANSNPGFGAPGFGAPGFGSGVGVGIGIGIGSPAGGFGPGVSGGATGSFIGSGFARSTR